MRADFPHLKTRLLLISTGALLKHNIVCQNPQFELCFSGLDVVSINNCMQLLKDLARQGRTIICTIHQPSASMFNMFDMVYMLAKGQCIYQGSSQQLVPFLGHCGLSCPPSHNPADYGNTALLLSVLISPSSVCQLCANGWFN